MIDGNSRSRTFSEAGFFSVPVCSNLSRDLDCIVFTLLLDQSIEIEGLYLVPAIIAFETGHHLIVEFSGAAIEQAPDMFLCRLHRTRLNGTRGPAIAAFPILCLS